MLSTREKYLEQMLSELDSDKLTKNLARKIAKEYAQYEVSRLLDHFMTCTSNGRWIMSEDLGGAMESGFAWSYLDMKFVDNSNDPVFDVEMAKGKDKQSLLKYLHFDKGKDVTEFWIPIGEVQATNE